MNHAKLKNLPAAQAYFRILKRWRHAGRNQGEYDESTLKFLFNQLEQAYRAVGYDFGDQTVSMTHGLEKFAEN
jgi:hypothetical protein